MSTSAAAIVQVLAGPAPLLNLRKSLAEPGAATRPDEVIVERARLLRR